MDDAGRAPLSPHAEWETTRHLARAMGWPLVDLRTYAVSCGILRRVSADLACRLRFVPIVFNGRRVILVVDDPYTAMYLSVNPQLLGPPSRRSLEFALTTPGALDRCLRRRITLVRD